MLAACRELGIGFVAYSPLGRGFLTGQLKSSERSRGGRLPPHIAAVPGRELRAGTSALVGHVASDGARRRAARRRSSRSRGCSRRGEDVVPIPGTKRVRYLEENLAADRVTLEPADLERLNSLFPPGAAQGDRYGAVAATLIDRS